MRHHADDTLLIFAAVVVALLAAAAGRANESFSQKCILENPPILIAIKAALDSNKR